MEAQEIFDTVAKHLFEQGERSVSASGKCVYRGPRGLRCAAGAVIPDALYSSDMDSDDLGANNISAVLRRHPDLLDHIGAKNDNILTDLQWVHDRTESWVTTGDMRGALRAVSRAHSLSPTILETLSFKDR